MNKLSSLKNSPYQIDTKIEQPSIELSCFTKGTKLQSKTEEKTIVFVLQGNFNLSYEHFFNKNIIEGKAFTLPPECKYTILFNDNVRLLIFRPKGEIYFSEKVSLKNLQSENDKKKQNLNLIEVIPQISVFLEYVISNINNGLTNEEFLKINTKLLLHILYIYYDKEILKGFFNPIMSNNISFSDFVLKNYSKVKTVHEFANLYSYSVSRFEKKFKKVFGSSVFKWMTEKKVNVIYHEIKATDKSLKSIAKEAGFSSPSQFNDYCKKHFGMPPGKMRKETQYA